MSVKEDVGPKHLLEAADADGIACATVKDGHVLVLTRKHLEDLLATMKEAKQDKCILFVKRPDFAGAN
jgi:hypothetical protein